MKTVEVDRARWRRGTSSLLLDCDGKSCVQGFVYRGYGAPDQDLLNLAMDPKELPEGLPDELGPCPPFRLMPSHQKGTDTVGLDFAGSLPVLLATINDMQAERLRPSLRAMLGARGKEADELLPAERRATYQRLLRVHDDPELLREAWLIEELKPLGLELVFS